MTEATLGSAQIAIRAVTDKLDSDLSGARKMVTGVLNDIKKPVMLGMAAVTGAIAAVGTGLLVYTGHATMAAAKTSEMRAVLNLLGERAGWTASEIEGNVKAMRDLGIRTDVAQDMLAQFARNQLDAADATMAARVAQDLAVLSGRDSSETLAELNYAVQTQNSSLQVFRDLGIQAGDALKAYADSVGKTTDELDKAERMQAMLNAVQEAGINIAGVYATAMDEPGKAMRSLGRHFYETSLAVGEHFLPVLGKGVDFVTDFIKEIRGLLEEGAPLGDLFASLGGLAEFAAEKMFGLANDGMGGLAERIGPAIERVTEIVTLITDLWFLVDKGWLDPLDALKLGLTDVFGAEVAEKVMDIIAKVQAFMEKVEEVISPIQNWIKENAELEDLLISLSIVIGGVLAMAVWTLMLPFIKLFVVVAALTLIVGLLRKAWEEDFLGIRTFVEETLTKIRDWWAEHGEEIIAKAQEIYETVKEGIEEGLRAAQEAVRNALDAIRDWWAENGAEIVAKTQEIYTNIQETIGNALDAIRDWWAENGAEIVAKAQEIWNLIWVVIETVIETIRPAIETFVKNVKENLHKFGPTIEAVKKFFATLGPYFEAIFTIVGAIVLAAVAVIVGLFHGLANAIGSIIAGIAGILTGLITFLTGWMQILTGIFQLIIGLVTGDGEKIKQAWQSIKDGVVNIVEGLITAIVAAFEGIWGAIVGFLEGFVTGIVGFFETLVDKLVGNSIVPDMIESIVDWFKALPGLAIDAAMAGLSAMVDLGRDLIGGLIQGIMSGVGALTEAVRGAAQSALDAAKRLLGIRSESSVFRLQVGHEIGAGWAKGLAEMGPQIVAAAGKLADLSLGAASQALTQDYSRQMTVHINTQQTTGSIYRDLALVEAMMA